MKKYGKNLTDAIVMKKYAWNIKKMQSSWRNTFKTLSKYNKQEEMLKN